MNKQSNFLYLFSWNRICHVKNTTRDTETGVDNLIFNKFNFSTLLGKKRPRRFPILTESVQMFVQRLISIKKTLMLYIKVSILTLELFILYYWSNLWIIKHNYWGQFSIEFWAIIKVVKKLLLKNFINICVFQKVEILRMFLGKMLNILSSILYFIHHSSILILFFFVES